MKKKISLLGYFILSLLINSQIFPTDILNDALDVYGSSVHATLQCCCKSITCVGECAHFCASEFAPDRTPAKDKIVVGIISAAIAIVLGLDGYFYFTKDQSDKQLEHYKFDKRFQSETTTFINFTQHNQPPQELHLTNLDHFQQGHALGTASCHQENTEILTSPLDANTKRILIGARPCPPKKIKPKQSRPRLSKFLYAMQPRPKKYFDKRFRNNGRKK